MAGHTGDVATARSGLDDADPAVRGTALAALARAAALTPAHIVAALADPDPTVRRRACEVAATGPVEVAAQVLERLGDQDAGVVEVAAWALGELGERGPLPRTTVADLSRIATDHTDPLAREAAVAALGAIGDVAGLSAILRGTTDKPTIRRRAVLALAPFEGPDVDAALERASHDHDWQVREAAALLLGR